jgi:hypothetical protein
MTKEIVFNSSESDWGHRLWQMQGSIETTYTELEERLRFETLLAETSARLVNLPADQIDGEIEGAQRRIAAPITLEAPNGPFEQVREHQHPPSTRSLRQF